MNKTIQESFNFLLSEYNRLKTKEQKKTITKEEKETLDKLKSFIRYEND